MRVFLVLLSLTIASLANGQTSAPPPAATPKPAVPLNHSVSLQVQSVGTGGKSTVTRSGAHTFTGTTTDGSTTADVTTVNDKQESKNQTSLQIAVHNLAPLPDTVAVEWYFTAARIASPKAPGGKEYLFDHGAKDIKVDAGAVETFNVSSKEAVAVTRRKASTVTSNNATFSGGVDSVGSHWTRGTMMHGWFVRLTAGGKVLAVRGSSQTYEDIAKDQTKISALEASK